MTFVDLRDRYGITQLTFNTDSDATLRETKPVALAASLSCK
jgi:aspartyl-tRNA synthetase